MSIYYSMTTRAFICSLFDDIGLEIAPHTSMLNVIKYTLFNLINIKYIKKFLPFYYTQYLYLVNNL